MLDEIELAVGDPARSGAAQPQPMMLRSAVHRRHEVLGPGLGPHHRTAHRPAQHSHQQLFGCGLSFSAEAAADIGHYHPDRVRIEPADEGQRVPDPVRGLGGRVEGEAAAVSGPFGRGRAGLHRNGGQTLTDQRDLDGDLTSGEVQPGAGCVSDRQLEGKVGPRGVVDQRAIGGGVGQRHHRLLGLYVHDYQFGRVGRGRGGVGHHHRYRLAYEPDAVAGQQRSAHQLVDDRDGRQVGQFEVGCGEHAEHAGLGAGIGGVHADQTPASHGGSNEAHAGCSVEAQVGHVAGPAREHPRVLGAQHPIAQHAHVTVSCPADHS